MSIRVQNYALIRINRDKGPAIIKNKGLLQQSEKTLLIQALPYGKPEQEVLKLISLNENIYLSYLKLSDKEDKGAAIILELQKEQYSYNPIGFLRSLNKITNELLEKQDVNKKEIELNYEEPTIKFQNYEDLDLIVFSILTKQPTALLGKKEDALEFISSVWECAPLELKQHLSFTVQASSLTENVVILSLPLLEDNIRTLEANKEKFSFLIFDMKKCFGKYSSPACINIANLYRKGKILEVRQEIKRLYDLCILTDKVESPLDFAKDHKLQLADAMLVQWMRANHFGLRMEENFLEYLDHMR